MTARDRLARALLELAGAEAMGVDTDRAMAEVETAQQEVDDELGVCPHCGCDEGPDCPLCAEDCQEEA